MPVAKLWSTKLHTLSTILVLLGETDIWIMTDFAEKLHLIATLHILVHDSNFVSPFCSSFGSAFTKWLCDTRYDDNSSVRYNGKENAPCSRIITLLDT